MIKMYTTTTCPDCTAAKLHLDSLGIGLEEIDITEDAEAAEFVMEVNDGRRSVPTLRYGTDAESLSRFERSRLIAFLERNGLLEQAG